MSRNLIILSDGTGQKGGLSPQELGSNIWKFFVGSSPNGALSETDQLVFYDPGIGAAAVKSTLLRRAWDAFCGATGIGLTPNIIDCYAAVIRLWCPGDRVFLFGFSRGAYTARGVGTVMRLCGVPVRAGDGTLLSQDKAQAREVATEAVKRVYQHVLSSREVAELTQQRDALAKLFREKYGADENGQPNAAPHFIGVFDTVSAIGGREFLAVALSIILVVLITVCLLWAWPSPAFVYEFWKAVALSVLFGLAITAVIYTITHIKFARDLHDVPFWKRFHIAPPRFKYDDESLGYAVGFARQALSIDESRASFDRVRWGEMGHAAQLVRQCHGNSDSSAVRRRLASSDEIDIV